jgi:hypothetical protein
MLLADREGYLWAREYLPTDAIPLAYVTPSDAPTAAFVFHPDGQLLGSVELPRRFTPWEIGTDFALGVEIDDQGVNELVLYGLSGR